MSVLRASPEARYRADRPALTKGVFHMPKKGTPEFPQPRHVKAAEKEDAAPRKSTVVKLELVEVGESFRFNPDDLLESAKGNKFTMLAILGQKEDGELFVSGSANAGETLILIELAKHRIVHQV